MKNTRLGIILWVFITPFSGCDFDPSVAVNDRVPSPVQTKPEKTPPDLNFNGDPANTSANNETFECVRSEPEPIIKKEILPKTAFHIEKNKEFPFQHLGYETVEFQNGDKLLIENIGCENYTLVFNFETGRFNKDENDVRFWYETVVKLIEET